VAKLKGKVRAKDRKKKLMARAKKYNEYKKRLIETIKLFDDPILKEKCEFVTDISSVKDIIINIKRVLAVTENGVGLCASQIGYTKQIIAIRPNVHKNDISIMINPQIVNHSEESYINKEGCLSYPGIVAPISRYKTVTIKFEDENGKVEEKEYMGFEGIIAQHEIDHLLGKCQLYDFWKEKQ